MEQLSASSARRSVTAAALAGLLVACASGDPEPPRQVLDSRVRDRAVRVDGTRQDWEGNLTRVGDRDVFAGFHRREDALYVAVVSQDPAFDARVFGSGLTVWFDASGGRRSGMFGLRFPVFGPEARKRLRADSAPDRPDRERLLRAAGDGFVLVRDGADEERLSPDETDGLRVAASVDRGLFTWEARVPLGGGPAALRASGRDTISVGMQAGGDQGETARPSPGEREASDSAAGGRRGGPARAGPGDAPPLEIWVRVSLRQSSSFRRPSRLDPTGTRRYE